MVRDLIKLKAHQKRHYESQKRRGVLTAKYKRCRNRKKMELIVYKGGKCQKCGYNKCNAALDFHHKSDDKTKGLGDMICKLRPLDVLKREADKCILLCSNCHRELHHNS